MLNILAQLKPCIHLRTMATSVLRLRTSGTTAHRQLCNNPGPSPISAISGYPRMTAQWLACLAAKGPNRRNISCNAEPPSEKQGNKRKAAAGVARQTKTAGRRASNPKPTVLKIPGIGPKNAALLIEHQLDTIESLQKLHFEKHGGNRNKTIEFLKNQVVIRNKTHRELVVSYLEQESKQEPEQANSTVTLSLEGNIGAGKSTFLQYISKADPDLGTRLKVMPEPVDKWQKIMMPELSRGADKSSDLLDMESHNILEEFYKDPKRYAYTFQNYIFITRFMQERDSRGTEKPLRLLERSVFSDRMVFVRALTEDQSLSKMELALYDSWFGPILEEHTSLVPDGFVYLRAEPDTCLRRLTNRSRTEEAAVQLPYLEGLHRKHEEWLNVPLLDVPVVDVLRPDVMPENQLLMPENQLVMPAKDLMLAPPASIASNVHIVRSKTVPYLSKHLEQVPALVLDIDSDFDVHKDVDRQLDLANKVKEYYDYVRDLKAKKYQLASKQVSEEMLKHVHGVHLPGARSQIIASASR